MKLLLLRGNHLHPKSIKYGQLFLCLILICLSIMWIIEGEAINGILYLLLSVLFGIAVIFLFSEKSNILPFILIEDNYLTIRKSVFSRKIRLKHTQIKAIHLSKNKLVISSFEHTLVFSELNDELLNELNTQLLLSSYRALLKQHNG